MLSFDPYFESVQVLRTGESIYENDIIRTVLEDANSPVTRKYQEKMYKSVINKAHIDFGDIPKSNGNIRNYSGYATMTDTLNALKQLATDAKANNVIAYVNIIEEAITNIADLSATYEKGFSTKTEYVAMEYDTFVFFCVEATSALIYSFVDIMKDPGKDVLDMKIKNTKLRADEFYFEQLKKFNRVQKNMGIEYRKMLETMCNKGRENFVGLAEIVGAATVMAVATAIVPVTREVIYQIYNFRGKLSQSLEIQANFLELNRTCIENDEILTADKKKKILTKQENLAKKLKKLSDDIRVKSAKSITDSKKELGRDNKLLSIDNIKDEISNSDFEIM